MNPKNNPPTENAQPKKFNVNVDGITCMMINKGMIQPENNRIKPRLRRRRGLFIMADITNMPQNDSARVQNRAEIFHRMNPQWLSRNVDGSDSLWAVSLQIILGILTILSYVNIVVALLHQAGAIALFALTIYFIHRFRALDAKS